MPVEKRQMRKMLFCNIGWMEHYQGNVDKKDNLIGGGSYPDEHGRGHEVCNFVPDQHGYVYGHVETIKGKRDRNIRIKELLGGSGDSIAEIDVIWTATDPVERGRKIIGWYRNATVFKARQYFDAPPTAQHDRDDITDFRIMALAEDAICLPKADRQLKMPSGKGWMGHTPWWSPSNHDSEKVHEFITEVLELMGDDTSRSPRRQQDKQRSNGGASSLAYIRYIKKYEVTVSPRHYELQLSFKDFLETEGKTRIVENQSYVDISFRDRERGKILAEVKPCDDASCRYAVRTAIGQLLDYRQRDKKAEGLMVVIDAQPKSQEIELALHNGIGIAYPHKGRFKIRWPSE